jgi:hypothetical protein
MTNHPNRSGQRYDIAFWGNAMIACIPTGGDMEKAVAEEGERARIDFGDDYSVVSGVHLTDEPRDTDEIVYSGSCNGWLSDTSGRTYNYAVKR